MEFFDDNILSGVTDLSFLIVLVGAFYYGLYMDIDFWYLLTGCLRSDKFILINWLGEWDLWLEFFLTLLDSISNYFVYGGCD